MLVELLVCARNAQQMECSRAYCNAAHTSTVLFPLLREDGDIASLESHVLRIKVKRGKVVRVQSYEGIEEWRYSSTHS
jgi:hypothetical protein